MAPAVWVRSTLCIVAASLATLLAACGPETVPPPPAAAVTLSPRIVEQASAYRGYMTRTSAISPAFADGLQVADALRTGVAYEPRHLVQGAVAYGAVAALQDPAFVAGVRTYARDVNQRAQLAQSIIREPSYAFAFSGASSAAGLVTAALGDEGRRIFEQGKLVKQAAYEVQRAPWSKAEVPNRDVRLALAKSLSATPQTGDVAETLRLQQAAVGGASLGLSAPPAGPPYSPLVVRSLALAALAVLGEAGDVHFDQIAAVTSEPSTGACLNMAKLNLYQCLAVSKPHYEDVFCLGQHVMMDTGRCLIKGAGAQPPVDVLTIPLTVATAIPVAAAPVAPAPSKP